jgi:malto-oligosyltrehalose synthase/4-alpha-glucanotransferase
MQKIISSYRIQFHKDFNFSDLEKIIQYLDQLGISTLYASPIFKAVAGSNHGYDVLDPSMINPEIGDHEKLMKLSETLRSRGINWLQDIVPNHMAFFPENPWVMDLLEKGNHSLYKNYFDIDPDSHSPKSKLMLPFLGTGLEKTIEKKEIKIIYEQGRFWFKYYESKYPLQPRSYARILNSITDPPEALQQLAEQLEKMHHVEDPKIYQAQWKEFLQQMQALDHHQQIHLLIRNVLESINQDAEQINRVSEEQHYRLCHWQETDGSINYRRFFTVNGLICLNIQDPDVFEDHHQYVLSLFNEGVINGFRIDHIDGLFDPAAYLEDLQRKTGSAYIVVEKILEQAEELPTKWPVKGTTGYEFLALVNNLFTLKSNEENFTRYYNGLVKEVHSVSQLVRNKKSLILYHQMGGELENLFQLLMNSGLVQEKDYAEMRTEDIRTAIAEFLIHCPVYRFYGNSSPLPDEEKQKISAVISQARTSRPDLERSLGLLENILLNKTESMAENEKVSAIYFYQRCMQFSGPLMAKGVEDTLMYTYNRFIAHNEVGDAPSAFGISSEEFHNAMLERQKKWPKSLNATSTHDTKRGEDVRARLNVISEIPGEWEEVVEEWRKMNHSLRSGIGPDVNDEYFIYQTICGTLPYLPFDKEEYLERLEAYFTKAFREAKTNTNWTDPNTAYEDAVKNFVREIFNDHHRFPASLENFLKNIADHGMTNSLSQLILKSTCPGLPDIYQGCELWDLSMVDPDNRRPVDFELRETYLEELEKNKGREDLLRNLWEERTTGKIKLWLTQTLLTLRKKEDLLFSKGEYLPVKAEGKYREHIFSFVRKFRNRFIVIMIPLHTMLLSKKTGKSIEETDWEDTRIILPFEALSINSVINRYQTKGSEIIVRDIFKDLPYGLLEGNTKESERGSGILLHLSSLPSSFGIGDMGPAAFNFAEQLSDANQRYWQILPVNPTEEGQGFSPYSATSSFAGNTLFISPEILAEQGLLTRHDLKEHIQPCEGWTDYISAAQTRRALLPIAYQNFIHKGSPLHKQDFHQFLEKEAYWLDDLASYIILKEHFEGAPWFDWPEKFALRDHDTLQDFFADKKDRLNRARWEQFIFDQQWRSLKKSANDLGIKIIGDLPFYVSYDSVDVWAHQEIFELDNKGKLLRVAGVPPDAFSNDGQLWGMPLYRWDVLKEKGYTWWIERLKKNIEMFDLIRLDHFRAFEAYWAVESGEATAKQGKWVRGPGEDFFDSVQKALVQLPFIAEDLGDISPEVYTIRDAFHFPGMKVLQFAFGENFNQSEHIPHWHEKNFVVYTGTHDNNTIRGWYRSEAEESMRQRIELYAGRPLEEDEIPDLLCRMAMASVATTAIIPLQDLLGLDEMARMNTPSSVGNNWRWRLTKDDLTMEAMKKLKLWTWLFRT